MISFIQKIVKFEIQSISILIIIKLITAATLVVHIDKRLGGTYKVVISSLKVVENLLFASKIKFMNIKFLILIPLFITKVDLAISQNWVKAQNVDCYYYASLSDVFRWTGGCQNGYCNGYGTLQFFTNGIAEEKYIGTLQNGKREGYGTYYYANGKKNYEGYFKNDLRNGFGVSYHDNGDTLYQGYWKDNKGVNEELLYSIGKILTDYIVAYMFDGGTNVIYDLTKVICDRDGSLKELRVKMTFNGNKASWIKYEGTLLIKTSPFTIDFIDYNKNFEAYIYLKTAEVLIEGLSKIIDDFDQ